MQQASIPSNTDKELLILHASGRVLLVGDKVKFVHKEQFVRAFILILKSAVASLLKPWMH